MRQLKKTYRLFFNDDRRKARAYLDEQIRWWRLRQNINHPPDDPARTALSVLQDVRQALLGRKCAKKPGDVA